MNSVELAKSIYERATQNNKKTVWVSQKQERLLFDLLYAEKRVYKGESSQFIAMILPNGEWVKSVSIMDECNKQKIKKVYVVNPPHYIKSNGFITKKLIII